MSDTKTIELGASEDATGPAGQPAWPAAPSRWLSAVIVVVCALGLAAGAPPGPALTPGHTVAGVFDRVVLDDARAYTVRGASASSRVDAYGLGDGAHLWSTAVRGTVVRMLVRHGVLVVSAEDTLAIDAASGRVRWRQRYANLVGQAGEVAIVVSPGNAMAGRDIGTGEPRWTSDLSPDARTVVEYAAGRPRVVELAEWREDGTLELRDPASGAVRRRTTVSRIDGSVTDAFLVQGTLVLGETASTGIRLYNSENGRMASLPRLNYPSATELARCGRYVCAGNNGGLTAFVPATGRRVWHLDRWNVFRDLDAGVALVYDGTGLEEGDGGALVDPVTGRVLDRLSRWRPTDATLGPDVVLWHRMPAGGLLLAVHNAHTGQRTVLGRVDGWSAAPTCEVNATHLVCFGGEELAIWPVAAAL